MMIYIFLKKSSNENFYNFPLKLHNTVKKSVFHHKRVQRKIFVAFNFPATNASLSLHNLLAFIVCLCVGNARYRVI